MKFLLIFPKNSSILKRGKYSQGIAPPLGLLYLAKILEEDGINIKLFDFTAEEYSRDKIQKSLSSIDVIGITVLSGSTTNVKEIIKSIKQIDSEIPVIIGGGHCTIFPKQSLTDLGADICVQGDGENTILEIKKALIGKIDLSNVRGVYYKYNNGIKSGKTYRPITNLDLIPFPARHLVKHYVYGKIYNPLIKKGEFTTISTGRGCPYNCNFCAQNAVNLQLFRKRSTDNIMEEIREIYNDGFIHLGFMEDSFLFEKRQATKVFEMINKEKIDMNFYITSSHVNSADQNLYSKMKKAGVVRINFDIISGNNKILNYYNTQTSREKIKHAIKLSKKAGFFTSGTFLIGAPNENKSEIMDTVNFAKSLLLDSVTVIPLKYIAGSDIWTKALEAGKISQDDYLIQADTQRNLNNFNRGVLDKYCKNIQILFKFKLNYYINGLKYLLRTKKNIKKI